MRRGLAPVLARPHRDVPAARASSSRHGRYFQMPSRAQAAAKREPHLIHCSRLTRLASLGRLEKFLSPSPRESDSVTARGNGRMERASHGAKGLFRRFFLAADFFALMPVRWTLDFAFFGVA